MTASPVTPEPAAAGRARLVRHVPLPGGRGSLPEPGDRPAGRDLVLAATTVVGMAAVLTGPPVWLAAFLILAAVAIGTVQVLADIDGPASERGVPIESVFLPTVAALGCLGAIRLVPLGLGMLPALLLTGLLIDRTLAVESRIATATQAPADDDRSETTIAMLVVALVAFVGVAAIVPGGIAGLEPAGSPVRRLPIGDLVLIALADAAIAALLGYRASALRGSTVRVALWAALTDGVAIAIGAAAIRAMGIPRLVGPALLMLLFYLWDSVHADAPTRRRDPRWIWQTVALAGLGALVAIWNLRLVG